MAGPYDEVSFVADGVGEEANWLETRALAAATPVPTTCVQRFPAPRAWRSAHPRGIVRWGRWQTREALAAAATARLGAETSDDESDDGAGLNASRA